MPRSKPPSAKRARGANRKIEAVRLMEKGETIATVASRIGISERTLQRAMRERKLDQADSIRVGRRKGTALVSDQRRLFASARGSAKYRLIQRFTQLGHQYFTPDELKYLKSMPAYLALELFDHRIYKAQCAARKRKKVNDKM